MQNHAVFQTYDGLTLAYHRYGTPGGKPMFYFHGLPGSRYEAELLHDAAVSHGVDLIAPDRFGYGEATPVDTDRYLRWVSAIDALADELHFSRFYLLAASGGGPYALACASGLPKRVIATSVACGLGPLSVETLYQAMPWFERLAAWFAKQAPLFLLLSYGVFTHLLARYFPQKVLTLVGWYNGGTDRRILAEPWIRKILCANLRCAFQHGSLGGVHDLMAVTEPWPFALAAIGTLQLWHGDQDPIVPLLHSQWLKQQVPHAQLQVVPGEGHFSLPIQYAQPIISTLVENAASE